MLAWGSAFVAIRAASSSVPPGALAFGRALVSTVLLTLVALLRPFPMPARGDLLRIAFYGILWQGVYSLALNEASRHVDAGTAAMLVGSGPLLIALLAGFFLHEGFPRRLLAGLAVAFMGSALIGFTTSQRGETATFGLLLLILAVLAYAAAVVIQKSVVHRVAALQVTWLGCLAASIALLPFAPSLLTSLHQGGATAAGWVAYLGIVPTALGFVTWSYALSRTTAGRTGAWLYLVPVVAVILGWLVLSEAPSELALAGGALCLAGVYLAQR
ncbi:MAG: DMT family transporter [Anaerolineales bacterium]|nr:DMT family transporter [Anaerolineales bacterium]